MFGASIWERDELPEMVAGALVHTYVCIVTYVYYICTYVHTYLPLLILIPLPISTSLEPSAAVRASRPRNSSTTLVSLLLLLLYSLWSSRPKICMCSNLYECVCMYATGTLSVRYPHCRRRHRDH